MFFFWIRVWLSSERGMFEYVCRLALSKWTMRKGVALYGTMTAENKGWLGAEGCSNGVDHKTYCFPCGSDMVSESSWISLGISTVLFHPKWKCKNEVPEWSGVC